MNILIVTHYFLPHKGGIEFVAYNQAKELIKQGHKVTIVSSKIGNEPEEELIDGIKVKRVKAWNWFEEKWGVPYPVLSPKIISLLNQEVKNADIVHVHDFFYLAPFFATLIAKINKKPIILMQHVKTVKHSKWIVNLIQSLVKNTYGNFVINSAYKILVCNEDVGKWLKKEDKVNFIENSVDIHLFEPTTKENKIKLRKKHKLPLDKPIVIFVGRFVEVKGFDRLFEARDDKYLILFIGQGTINKEMKKTKNVKFLDSMPQDKLKEFYQLSDVFVLPSRSEGFPLTVLEAISSGLPIIVSRLPIYEKHLDKNNISIITPTPENIRKEILNITSNPTKSNKMSKYSREEAVRKFGWKRNAEKLLSIYTQAIKENETVKNKKTK